jgi:hypothetical protein
MSFDSPPIAVSLLLYLHCKDRALFLMTMHSVPGQVGRE